MDGEHVAPREVPTEIAKLRSNVYRAMLIQAVPSLESSHRVGRAGGVHLPAGPAITLTTRVFSGVLRSVSAFYGH